MTHENLSVSDLTFTTIKQNLRSYLENQSEFSDYDFDGSALNILLDILAYSTHYTGTYTNFALAETFLDSAVKRSSVVSRAKELGYTPRSKTAAKAQITLSFTATGNPTEYILPKGTKFTASAGSTTYNFVTTQDITFDNVGNIFTKTIDIYQGNFTSYTYVVNLNNTNQDFIIPSEYVDTRFLAVLFKENSSIAEYDTFMHIDNYQLGDIDGNTQLYLLQERYDGYFELEFGNGVIGKKLSNGNILYITYLVTDGADANGAKSFSLASTISDIANVSITTALIAQTGDDKEDVESIRYLAPFYYASQGRAVTEDDYKVLIKNTFSDIDDVAVWGGEDNIPAYYGKVFIAIKPKFTNYFSNVTKQDIQNNILNKFNIVSVRPEVVDPDYLDVSVDTVVTYNAKRYNRNVDINLEQTVIDNVETFFNDQTNKFGKSLYFSKLTGIIDNTSTLITNSITNITVEKSERIFAGVSGQYSFSFNNSIHPGSVISNVITISGIDYYITDIQTGDTTGSIAIYKLVSGNKVYLTQNTGTIDYNTGDILIDNLKIDSTDTTTNDLIIRVSIGAFIDPLNPNIVYKDNNVYTNSRDQIIRLKENGVTVTLLADNSV